ncbi:Sodium/Potassium-Transporting Atpase Subunit Beta-1 [Manis pentadactyla]|nr:Sodium/Potassium-Transporting Atpase Subunit Beta-1 [Manis pentadactyla]
MDGILSSKMKKNVIFQSFVLFSEMKIILHLWLCKSLCICHVWAADKLKMHRLVWSYQEGTVCELSLLSTLLHLQPHPEENLFEAASITTEDVKLNLTEMKFSRRGTTEDK